MSANFLGADDYRLQPLVQSPLASSDDDEVFANEREKVQIHEHLFQFADIGVEIGFHTGFSRFSRSNKDNINKNETTIAKLTKRLGEVDYTEVESNILQAFLQIGMEILIPTIRLSHILKGFTAQ